MALRAKVELAQMKVLYSKEQEIREKGKVELKDLAQDAKKTLGLAHRTTQLAEQYLRRFSAKKQDSQ